MNCDMGLGALASDRVTLKRKFRWRFYVNLNCGGGFIPASFVKLAARPNLSIEETELNYLNAKTWIPGKGTWETITVTYYDVGGNDADVSAGSSALFTWINSVYQIANTGATSRNAATSLCQSSKRADYAGTGVLTLLDGCGQRMEQWTMYGMWPQAVNFGELDYSSSEEVTIELTLRYDAVDYVNYCGTTNIQQCCTPC